MSKKTQKTVVEKEATDNVQEESTVKVESEIDKNLIEKLNEISEKKDLSELSEEELKNELQKVSELLDGIKFKSVGTAEQYKYFQLFLSKKASWIGINAFAVHDIYEKFKKGDIYDTSTKVFSFRYKQLEALRYMLQKYEGVGYEEAKMFVEITKVISNPLQDAMQLMNYYSEVENRLTALKSNVNADQLNEMSLNIQEEIKKSTTKEVVSPEITE